MLGPLHQASLLGVLVPTVLLNFVHLREPTVHVNQTRTWIEHDLSGLNLEGCALPVR